MPRATRHFPIGLKAISHNTWIHRFARITIVRPLATTSVTPNQVTTVRLLTGIAAAAVLAVMGESGNVIAATLFLLSILLDRADGDLARLTGQTSPIGHKYDLVSDTFCNALIFIGLGIGLRNGAYGPASMAMGLAAGLAIGAVLWLVMRIEELEGARAAELGETAGFDPDDAMLVVPIAITLGGAEGLLLAASIGAPSFAVFFFWLFRRKLRRSKTG